MPIDSTKFEPEYAEPNKIVVNFRKMFGIVFAEIFGVSKEVP